MWLPFVLLAVGFVALVWGADRFVSGAASSAAHLGLSKMVIGLTVVATGTSAPEIMVSLAAATDGHTVLAIGNAIGSNIANIGLVLGLTAMVRPLNFAPSVLTTEVPWLAATTTLGAFCLHDLYLGRSDGILLLSALAYLLWRLGHPRFTTPSDLRAAIRDELAELHPTTPRTAALRLLAGLIVLLASAQILVGAAVDIAVMLGVDELIIGLSIIAIGTSLPELAATISAAMKGHTDIAIGNVVGSNILNIVAVMAVPGLIHPTNFGAEVFWRDITVMTVLTAVLVLFAYGTGARIGRFKGLLICLGWIGYNVLLYHYAL